MKRCPKCGDRCWDDETICVKCDEGLISDEEYKKIQAVEREKLVQKEKAYKKKRRRKNILRILTLIAVISIFIGVKLYNYYNSYEYKYGSYLSSNYTSSTYTSGVSSSIGSTKSAAKEEKVTDSDDLTVCWLLSKDEVKQQLKSPSSAKFPFSYADEDVMITKSGNTYTVKSWVDAENSFGAKIRCNFDVKLEKIGSGKNAKWSISSCVVEE